MTKNKLIIGPAWIGDMVMAQGLFKLLKQLAPDDPIDVVAPTRTISLLTRMPEVRSAIEAPFLHFKFDFRQHYRLAQQLRKSNYREVIVLPGSFKSAVTPWLAGIKKRTGWLGETRYFALNDVRRLDKTKYPLMIERYLALGLPAKALLTKPYPYPALQVSVEARDALLLQHPSLVRGRPILALCIGAEFGPAKCWPSEYYAAVANEKISEGWDVWLVGSANERPNAQKIMQLTAHQCQDLTGQFSLVEMIDLLSLVSGVVSNDTGLMHIAASLKKPLVALYGSSSPDFTPPLFDEAIILKLNMDCQPCFKRTCPLTHYRCMMDLKPEQVLIAIASWNSATVGLRESLIPECVD